MDTAGAANRRSVGRQRVLVVDGDEDLRDVLRLILEEEGYDVRTVATGTEALALLQGATGDTGDAEPWVILLDHTLRGLDGLGVLGALRAKLAARRVAVVYMSAGGAETDHVQARLAALSVSYLRKPFDLDDVLAMVRAAATSLAETPTDGPRDIGGPRPRDDAPHFLATHALAERVTPAAARPMALRRSGAGAARSSACPAAHPAVRPAVRLSLFSAGGESPVRRADAAARGRTRCRGRRRSGNLPRRPAAAGGGPRAGRGCRCSTVVRRPPY